MFSRYGGMGTCLGLLLLCSVSRSSAQVVQLGARWIPTDLNYRTLSNLRQNSLQTLPEQIAGYGTLGIIPSDIVTSWLQQLISNPSFREGTVRWNPNNPAKCSSGRQGCTKSIAITVLEFDYVNPNGTDCNATALVAADALLPPSAVFVSGNSQYQPTGPVQYQIIRSPNSTAGNCTYVVQYPAPTQTLANQLCTAQQTSGPSCYNTSCIPCAANNTIVEPDNPSGCTPTSGVAPALVAAIEGAAQCLTDGGVGAFQCQVAYIANASACSQMHCFPGDGQVWLENGRSVAMQDLRIGDRVQVVDAQGSLTYDDIYFFGHRDPKSVGSYLKLILESRQERLSSKKKTLELSSKHFLPVSQKPEQAYRQAKMTQAQQVVPGDTVWVVESSTATAYTVSAVEVASKVGLWAPYTSHGTIVVNGVVASVHSEWILDGLLEWIGRPDLLPLIYQLLLSPVWLLYGIMGSAAFRQLDDQANFGAILTSPYLISTARTLFFALVIALIFPLGQKAGRTFAKRLSKTTRNRT